MSYNENMQGVIKIESFNPIDWLNLSPEIIKSINDAKAVHGWDSVGIRIQDGIEFTLGPIDHISSVWVDGEETGEELDGICAISTDDIPALCREACQYFGDHVAIIVGDNCGCSDNPDPHEIILKNAEVWEVLA